MRGPVKLSLILRRILVSAALLLVLLVIALTVHGVPKPRSMATRHLHRLTWTSAWQTLGAVREVGASIRSDGWIPGANELLVRIGGKSGRRVTIASPNGPSSLTSIPAEAYGISQSTESSNPVLTFLLDKEGNESPILFRWQPGTHPPVPLTKEPSRIDNTLLNPDGSLVSFTQNDPSNGRASVMVMSARDGSHRHAVVDGVAGYTEPIAWSPDGLQLLLLEGSSYGTSVPYLANIQSGIVARVVPDWGDKVNATAAVWSKDGKTLYLASDAGSEYGRLYALRLSDRSIRPLTPEDQDHVVDLHRLGGNGVLILTLEDEGIRRLASFDPATGILLPLPNAPGTLTSISVHPGEERLVENVHQDDGRNVVYVFDLHEKKLQQWAIGNAPATIPAPPAVNLSYPTFDSVNGAPRQINLIFKRPSPTSPKPWPVIINLHGGPADQMRPGWDPRDAFLQKAGFAVLEPNVRGSTGFGKTFETLDNGALREDAEKDVEALVSWVGNHPELDAARIGLLGGSAGGYLVLSTMTHASDRVRCGVDLFGFSDLAQSVMDGNEAFHLDILRAEFGDERDPSMLAYMNRISPINNVDRIKGPLLIFQGANDTRVKPDMSRRMVRALEDGHHDVQYIEANNEGHGLDLPLNQMYVGTAILDFYKGCLAKR